MLLLDMGHSGDGLSHAGGFGLLREVSLPLVIPITLREEGNTGIYAHIRQLRCYLEGCDATIALVRPFSWGRPLTCLVFGLHCLVSGPMQWVVGVAQYLHPYKVFLCNALRWRLAEVGKCVVFAQGPAEARAVLLARRGAHKPGHGGSFRITQADESVNGREIRRDGRILWAIRGGDPAGRPRGVRVQLGARDAVELAPDARWCPPPSSATS